MPSKTESQAFPGPRCTGCSTCWCGWGSSTRSTTRARRPVSTPAPIGTIISLACSATASSTSRMKGSMRLPSRMLRVRVSRLPSLTFTSVVHVPHVEPTLPTPRRQPRVPSNAPGQSGPSARRVHRRPSGGVANRENSPGDGRTATLRATCLSSFLAGNFPHLSAQEDATPIAILENPSARQRARYPADRMSPEAARGWPRGCSERWISEVRCRLSWSSNVGPAAIPVPETVNGGTSLRDPE